MRRNSTLWIAAWLLTLGTALWQRWSGPTYPVRVREEVGGAPVSAKLLRSNSISEGLKVAVKAPDAGVTGMVVWRRFPTGEPWSSTPLAREGDRLVATLPAQPMAGKLAYTVHLSRANPAGGPPAQLVLSRRGEPVVARFKGDVGLPLLLAHVIIIFSAMLYSARAGLEALARGPRLRRYVLTVTALFFVGGLILGPFVQKAAFNAFWTGWPFGRDLTDNKVALAMAMWFVAWLRVRTGRDARSLAIAAALVMLVIFSIPHSLFGSQFDYTRSTVTTGHTTP